MEGGCMPVYAVLGTDEGRVAEEASALFNELKPEGGDEFTNDLVEGIAANAEEAFQICAKTIEALQTFGFFGGAKVVWLKGANFLADDRTGGAERAKEGVEAILDVVKAGLGDEVTFLVSAAGIDKRRAFYKWLQKNAEVAVFDKIDVSKDGWEEEVAAMVMTRAKELKLTFEDDALELFVQRAGEETRQIGNELEKLFLYVGENGLIKTEAVQLMVPASRKGVIWGDRECPRAPGCGALPFPHRCATREGRKPGGIDAGLDHPDGAALVHGARPDGCLSEIADPQPGGVCEGGGAPARRRSRVASAKESRWRERLGAGILGRRGAQLHGPRTARRPRCVPAGRPLPGHHPARRANGPAPARDGSLCGGRKEEERLDAEIANHTKSTFRN